MSYIVVLLNGMLLPSNERNLDFNDLKYKRKRI